MVVSGKRILLAAAILFVVAALAMGFSAAAVFAAKDLVLEKESVDCSADRDLYYGYIRVGVKAGCTEKVKDAVSQDTDIVFAQPDYSMGEYVEVFPMGTGEATVVVTGSEGTVTDLKVKVDADALQYEIADSAYTEHLAYGHNKFEVMNIPGTKVTVKIGKDKYKVTLPKKAAPLSTKYVKIKKVYDLKTKVTVTFRKEDASKTLTHRVHTFTSAEAASARRKTFKVECYDLHKGDTVRLTVANKTYTKKIKKNYTKKATWVRFTTKKATKKNARFKVVIKNKYKKTLSTLKEKLTNGAYAPEDYDGDEDEE